MRVLNSTECAKVKECFTTTKEASMWESGDRTRCSAEVSSITLTMRSPMTDNGKTINYQAKELSTMKKCSIFNVPSTTKTGKELMITGLSTRVPLAMIAKMVKADFTYLMGKSSKVLSKTIWCQVMECL